MKQALLVTTLVGYLIVVAAFTIVPTRISQVRTSQSDHVNLLPLGYSFTCFRQTRRHPDLTSFCLRNTLGNIALFMPLGILLPLIFMRFASFWRVLAIALSLSIGIESIQFLFRYIGSLRAVDIDDVLLNTFGACLGYVAYRVMLGAKPAPTADGRPNVEGRPSVDHRPPTEL